MKSIQRTYLPLLTIIVLLAVAATVIIAGSNSLARTDRFWRFIDSQIRLHPRAQVVDIYKLMYQGAFGVAHIIPSRADAAGYLHEEIAAMPLFRGEPLLEPCNPDRTQFRVNLRPFLAAGYDTTLLIDAMMESVQITKGDTAQFIRDWRLAGDILAEAHPQLYALQYGPFSALVRSRGWPAVHHSRQYEAAYRPAYRVVACAALLRYFPQMKSLLEKYPGTE